MQPRVIVLLGNLLFAMFSTATLYVILPFLATLMPEQYTGFVFAGGAFVALMTFPFLPRLVARFGAQQLAIMIAVIEAIALLALAIAPNALAAIVLAAAMTSMQPFIAYQLDLLLEATVLEEGTTGRVRSMFLTAWNVGALASPLLIGALLAQGDEYDRVFLASAAILIPFIVLFAARKLPVLRPPKVSHIRETIQCLFRDLDLAAVCVAHLLLYLFFIWAPLYVPVYLHTDLGIPWSELGWVFSIMLIPYVLIQYPAGTLADRLLGDKELMVAGFIIAGISLAALSQVTSSTPIMIIAAILIASRAGAALIESMTEGHFFRRVSEKDVNSVSVFRGIWPLADVLAPTIGSLILIFGDFQVFFLATGALLVVVGVSSAMLIKDFIPGRRAVPQSSAC